MSHRSEKSEKQKGKRRVKDPCHSYDLTCTLRGVRENRTRCHVNQINITENLAKETTASQIFEVRDKQMVRLDELSLLFYCVWFRLNCISII